jgi:predicted dehydrogenase
MSTDQPVRFGVIGAGWFASRRHIPDIRSHPEAGLAALCRRDYEQLQRLRRQFEPERSFQDWQEMLDQCPLDAVVIATPHNLHFAPARAALERGVHVLVEKPMTIDPAEAWELARLARSKGLSLAVALNPPFWAHCHRIRGAIQEGRIGEVEALTFYFSGSAAAVFGDAPLPADLPGVVPPTLYRSDPEQCGGGYFIDGGSHLVSEVLWVTGLKAIAVSCHMDATPSDRRAALTLTLENGALATIVTLGDSQHAGRRVRNTIAGSRGTITVEGFDFLTTIDSGDESESFREADLPPIPGPVTNLVDAIRGHALVASPAEHGAAVVEIIHAAYESAATGQRVAV